MVARVPSRPAASATACAWLPEEYATTPRARTSAGSDEIFAYWTQNKHLEVEFRFDSGRAQDTAPFNSGWIFRTRRAVSGTGRGKVPGDPGGRPPATTVAIPADSPRADLHKELGDLGL